ncbi:cytochrome c [Aquabacterium sp. CECT 9606]|uniref:c-type cytochrome n=1 Tax=Aquabacterium sp. CECT 9606 TaxID=2845822 RepID=UPI001E427EDF|nr:c-type cytochrome [Aquabacterium sp. CECT 9606]CAH0347799.1 Cytochrome c4 [Aquabacterium sp. CECT 9606]
MKRLSSLIALASMVLTLSGVAHGSEAKAPAKPDLAAGEAKATAVCAACHTADGSRGAATYPILQGQHPEYLAKQLTEFKQGVRKNAVMNGMAAPLTPEDIRNLSAFYASKKAKDGFAKNKDTVALGEKIYRGGIAKKTVPACAACHGPSGSGIPSQYPRLGGQHADYVKAQLTAFRQGDRTNNASMSSIAANLSDKEIDALSDYIAGLR